jgi:hypothetical protein
MVAAISSELYDMPCCVLEIGLKLKFDHGVCFLWNDGLRLNKEIGQVCLILMGLLLWVLWKRWKEDIFCNQALKKQQNIVPWKTYIVLFIISHGSI